MGEPLISFLFLFIFTFFFFFFLFFFFFFFFSSFSFRLFCCCLSCSLCVAVTFSLWGVVGGGGGGGVVGGFSLATAASNWLGQLKITTASKRLVGHYDRYPNVFGKRCHDRQTNRTALTFSLSSTLTITYKPRETQ